MNRISCVKEDYPFRIDLSIVKTNNINPKTKNMIPHYNIKDSGVFDTEPFYEIEIELLNEKLRDSYGAVERYEKDLKYFIKIILSGLQESNFPISNIESYDVLNNYISLFNPKNKTNISSRDFIGPSSYTLQLNNIIKNDIDNNIPNINTDYCVTEKADGLRKLLYINSNGRLYLIDTNMKVQFTGCTLTNKDTYKNTLIDGEHIIHDKMGVFINLYAAFDIYFINNKDVRMNDFNTPKKSNTERYRYLLELITNIELKSSTNKATLPFKLKSKQFYNATSEHTIFDRCRNILNNIGNLEYETDGLIFTPSNLALGVSKKGENPVNKKVTWTHSFKWKPPEYNTIDFLFKLKKDENMIDDIKTVFQPNDSNKIIQYKVGYLYVGFNTSDHGYLNPYNDILEDNINPEIKTYSYKPMKFYPSNPYDDTAHICYVKINNDTKIIQTLENEEIEDNTII